MQDKKIYKTLAITFVPDPDLDGGQVIIDIGKYYDNNATRVVKAWAYSIYRDITAGSAPQEGDCYFFLEDTTVMQGATITPSTGTASNSDAPMIPGDRNGEFNFLGDAVLEQPVFTISITGAKRSAGANPPSFQWTFYIVIQLEFNFGNLNEQFEKDII